MEWSLYRPSGFRTYLDHWAWSIFEPLGSGSKFEPMGWSIYRPLGIKIYFLAVRLYVDKPLPTWRTFFTKTNNYKR